MERFKAFSFHFGISLIVFLIVLYLILYHWYPGFHLYTDGGIEGIRLVVGVDLVLGPVLTLCVYKKGKPGLKRDLILIGILQASCLAIGLYLIYNERPTAVIYADKQIYSVPQEMFTIFNKDPSILKTLPGPYPKRVYVDLGTDEEGLAFARRKQHIHGLLQYQTDKYKPYADFSPIVINWSTTTDELLALVPYKKEFILHWIKELGYTSSTIRFTKFSGRYRAGYMAIDSSTGNYIDVLANRDLRKPTNDPIQTSTLNQ